VFLDSILIRIGIGKRKMLVFHSFFIEGLTHRIGIPEPIIVIVGRRPRTLVQRKPPEAFLGLGKERRRTSFLCPSFTCPKAGRNYKIRESNSLRFSYISRTGLDFLSI
jgi:hypothetical protein